MSYILDQSAAITDPTNQHGTLPDPEIARSRQTREICLRMAIDPNLSDAEVVARADIYYNFIMNGKRNEPAD